MRINLIQFNTICDVLYRFYESFRSYRSLDGINYIKISIQGPYYSPSSALVQQPHREKMAFSTLVPSSFFFLFTPHSLGFGISFVFTGKGVIFSVSEGVNAGMWSSRRARTLAFQGFSELDYLDLCNRSITFIGCATDVLYDKSFFR